MALVITPFTPSPWLLQRGAEEKSFEAWGFSAPKKFKLNQGIGECTFQAPGALADSDPALAYDDRIKIKKNGVIWFQGRVVETPAMGDGPQEGISYRLADTWFDLDDLVFQQLWGNQYSSHLLLNVFPLGQLKSVRDVLLDVIAYAAAQGVAIQAGQVLPEDDEKLWFPPPNEVVDVSCGEVIKNQLRWVPQSVAWIDDSTEPPTFNCRRRHRCEKITFTQPPPPNDEASRSWLRSIKAFGIRKRSDLVRPAVVFKYEIRGSEDGRETLAFVIDQWPLAATGRERGALMQTFPLQGRVVSNVSAKVVTEEIDTDSLAWWKSHLATLAGAEVQNLKVTEVKRQSGLPRMLVPGGGQLALWMKHDDGTPVAFINEKITARIEYDLVEDKTPHRKSAREPVPLRIIATDAQTGTYWAPASIEEGDPIPQGLAKFIYEALATVQHEGTLEIVAEELLVQPGDLDPLGKLVNIAGMRAEWAAMDALIQRVDEDADSGTMTVSFGPPTHLGAADLTELLRVGRQRRRWTNPATQQNGEMQTDGSVEFGMAAGQDSGYTGKGKDRLYRVFDEKRFLELDAINGKQLMDFGGGLIAAVDKEDSVWKANPHAIAFRKVCVRNTSTGAKMSMLVWGSEPF